jgi:hypothetical protein
LKAVQLKVAIHQPQYFPWPRYVHKVISADIFVYLDTVQFSKNGVQNRNQIKTHQGALWLTVPVQHHFGQSLNEIEIAGTGAIAKHLKTVHANYAKTPGFTKWRHEVENLFAADYSRLVDVAIASTEWMLDKLDTKAERLRASSLKNSEGSASKLVASICKEVGATSYLTGTGSLSYLDPADFSGCEIEVQTWQPFEYQQTGTSEFIQDLSTLDLLLNCPDTAAELITTAGGWEPMTSR